MIRQEFVEVLTNYKAALTELGLTSIDAVFSFNAGKDLVKDNLAGFRSRLQIETGSPATTLFLKRYDRPPVFVQLKNWLARHRKTSCGLMESVATKELAAAEVNTPKIVSFGEQWGIIFEKRSFTITEKIPNAESLERKLPDFFTDTPTSENLKLRKDFILRLAGFIKKFHRTNYRHRDLYFSHIFCNNRGDFYLIDLARAFKPLLLRERFRIKDIAQLHYSAPAGQFSNTDRLRFYLAYSDSRTLGGRDKLFIRQVIQKTKRMARHDIRHGRRPAFLTGRTINQ